MNRAWNISYGLGCVGHGTKDTTIKKKESESPSMVVVVLFLDYHRRFSQGSPVESSLLLSTTFGNIILDSFT